MLHRCFQEDSFNSFGCRLDWDQRSIPQPSERYSAADDLVENFPNQGCESLQPRGFFSVVGLAEEEPVVQAVEVYSRLVDLVDDAPAFEGHGFEGFGESELLFCLPLVLKVHFDELIMKGVAGEHCGGLRSEVSDIFSKSVFYFEYMLV